MKKIKFFLIFYMLLWALPLSAAPLVWKVVSPGLEEAQYPTQDSHTNAQELLLYKVNLKTNDLRLVFDKDFSSVGVSVREMVQRSGALLGINAGFFDTEMKPLGLLIRETKEIVSAHDREPGVRMIGPHLYA
ncbi:MAG: hypothetical protein HQM15_05100 [Deltaproteobacteria bacterium]|nr:hypothetical protein [Deltaproteobacteria bacterium]